MILEDVGTEEIIDVPATDTKEEPKVVLSEVPENAEISVIEENNIKTTYTNEYNGVQIKNSSNYELTQEIMNPDIELENRRNVVIYHTHTCESYTPSEKFNYEMTGNYRTTDLNYSVSRVGDELQSYLEQYGFNVAHDKTINDYPAYTGSYNRSLKAVNNVLSNIESDIVIDLHRDAVGSSSDYAPRAKIGDEEAAQIMFVIGTDGGGLEHPNWQQNLKFAIKIQQKANELYPGLFRPIILRNSRYNQHVAKAAVIIEVGATGNTLEQCLASMKYLAKIMNEAL
ncbi:MAG: stage II sporulation protein P [Clostridia bacterium]|nr:stage II sporulation protein P [Clostridia bacterium]